ncbi:MAG: site-specific integrase [Cytophagales bacterium]|nr:site-specific integrase [Cytophagales bacterium]
MRSFQLHLEQRGYVAKSIQRAVYYASAYEAWLSQSHLTLREATYNDLLNYLGHLQKTGSSKSKCNEFLRNLRLYYDYLQLPNIAYGVKIRGETHQSMPFLTAEELDKIYHHFEPRSQKGYWRYSDKLLLGLIIYQVLDPRDLYRLCIGHLNLNEGTLYIPEGLKRKASRTLKLESHQILPLHHYITHHRDNTTEKLFSPQCSSLGRLQGQLKELFKQVKSQAQEIGLAVIRFNQLRQSRLTLWIRQYGLRQTQYMVGFRRVDNVERYRQQDTEDLRDSVLKYHPLG